MCVLWAERIREMCFIVFKDKRKSGVFLRVIDRVKLHKSGLTC